MLLHLVTVLSGTDATAHIVLLRHLPSYPAKQREQSVFALAKLAPKPAFFPYAGGTLLIVAVLRSKEDGQRHAAWYVQHAPSGSVPPGSFDTAGKTPTHIYSSFEVQEYELCDSLDWRKCWQHRVACQVSITTCLLLAWLVTTYNLRTTPVAFLTGSA